MPNKLKVKSTRGKLPEKCLPSPHSIAKRAVLSFPIVGIGGSAGGLEAFQELLKNLSAELGMAFVFIMHLSPKYKSMLAQLLARETKMPVSEITRRSILQRNHVYVIPSNANIFIKNGKLKLYQVKENGPKMPIDGFFQSLAKERGNRAIGVILSGTATDGTLGAEAIKAEGGIIFAQDEKSAKYGSMPQNAVSAGCVDFVLSPKQIANELERMSKHPYLARSGPATAEGSIPPEDQDFKHIFDILGQTKGLDFTHYKSATVKRRVLRRMILLKKKNLADYVKFLRGNPGEADSLYDDLLINVTSFFREPNVFAALIKKVFPAIFKAKAKNQMVRIWVPGCSSGEEAYSIAICLVEVLGNKMRDVPIRIFATDVSEGALARARRGIYNKSIKDQITPARLKKYFAKTNNYYTIAKQLREMCVFSLQNVFIDPPFSNLDLISCRNLLIYLQPVLQKNIFQKFHYALKPGGFLLLGHSESATGYSNYFKMGDQKQKIYINKNQKIRPNPESGQKDYQSRKLEIMEKPDRKPGKEVDVEKMVERIVLNEYAPCGVLIDNNMEVVLFRGHTGRYLESANGKPSLNLFDLAREGLALPLRAAIYKARKNKQSVKREIGNVKFNGHGMRVAIHVMPVKSASVKEEYFMVFFDEITQAVLSSKHLPKPRGKAGKDEEYVESMQQELAETKDHLQSVIEEHANVIEEAKTANEEILSNNEELQSINEELETAKEELQSSNEELITTNEELQSRNAEVSLLNNDLGNLLGSINMPVVMLGTDLVIRRITSQCEKALNIISTDVGRRISKIKIDVDIPDLEKTLLEVIKSRNCKTFEIKSREGKWYSVYIKPYCTLENKTEGVVVIFVDITKHKWLEVELARLKEKQYQALIENLPQKIFLKDTNSVYISCNENYARDLKLKPEEIVGKTDYDFFPKELADKYRADDLKIMTAGKTEEFEERYLQAGKERFIHTLKSCLKDDGNNIIGLFGLFWDITQRKQAEEALKQAYDELKQTQNKLIRSERLAVLGKMAASVGHELRNPLGVINNSVYFLRTKLAPTLKDEQISKHLKILEEESQASNKIVNDILAFARIKEPRLAETDINDSIEALLKNMNIPENIKVASRLQCGLPRVLADEGQLKQLFYNLVLNAVQAMPNGGELTIANRVNDEMMEVHVMDTGTGISPEIMADVFNPLFTTKTLGTGLGLMICQSIMEMHKGSIEVESELEKRTIFMTKFPIHHPDT